MSDLVIQKDPTADFSALTEIWERAVRATHFFLPEEKLLYYKERIPQEYLPQLEVITARKNGVIAGFMAISPSLVDGRTAIAMLFVDPALHDHGIGRALLEFANHIFGPLVLDVNEQNPGAVAFYKKCGFIQHGRSDLDDEGNPFPLLHLHKD